MCTVHAPKTVLTTQKHQSTDSRLRTSLQIPLPLAVSRSQKSAALHHGLLGYVWKWGSFFVMPLLALENVSPGEALYRSSTLVREIWGEAIVAGFSFPLLFFVLATPSLAFFFLAGLLGQTFGVAAVMAVGYWLLLAVVMFSAEQVFIAALYLYAKEGRVPNGFSTTDFKTAWQGLTPLPAGRSAQL